MLRFRIRTGPVISNLRFWGGFCSADISSSDNPAENFIAFRYSTSASDTTFKCCTKNGTTLTTIDSGITVAANTEYNFCIDIGNGTDCLFYINDTLTATMSSNLPSSSLFLGTILKITNLTASSRNFLFSRMFGTSQ